MSDDEPWMGKECDLAPLVGGVVILRSESSCLHSGGFSHSLTVPAAPSVSTDHTDETLKAELLRLCVPMQHGNGYRVEAIPKAALLDFFAIRALGARRG